MATLAEARTAVAAALVAAGLDVLDGSGDPPYARVFSGTVDPATIVMGRMEAQQRTVLLGGAWDSAAAADQLDTITQTALVAVRALAGYRVVSIGTATVLNAGTPQNPRNMIGRELITSTLITL